MLVGTTSLLMVNVSTVLLSALLFGFATNARWNYIFPMTRSRVQFPPAPFACGAVAQ